ncbi:MAG: alpha-1,4-glucan--maltose-1-phosphate maltosyltransferase [Flavobacterium sp. BFFFF2]|nr:MAG: alpha-1,4-glucan--maltose-1-phosphate maltosyltransferase [Flavobacterium sp. BFFFF2]
MQKQTRVIIEQVSPQLDGGVFPIKRVVGQTIEVTAHVFADGHDVVAASLWIQHENEKKAQEIRMNPTGNDEWEASFVVNNQGYYTYYIEGWVDQALNWQHGTERKIKDGQYLRSELLEGALYCEAILKKVSAAHKPFLKEAIEALQEEKLYDKGIAIALSEELHNLFTQFPTRELSNQSDPLRVYVDRKKALFSTWYEFFPRSAAQELGKHGTFKDCEALLPRVAAMGFDTLYFPPIHPIGEVNRKGKNNATAAEPGDVGSPWGIGSQYGGHKAVHPELGSIDDFKSLVQKAQEYGIEIAMDFALQAAPDHPYVKEHPQWFKWRPDGTVQYAENPPKKYQDILPIYFETPDWKALWDELLSAMLYWIETCNIRVFRVDNPHTKPYYFWGWLIEEVKKQHPDILFLSESFTRPKVMHELAKQGFTQSYSYFTWRNSKAELIEYMTELTQSNQKEFFRPNFWPNTPDILPYALQTGHESVYLHKYFLAATLSSSVGIYGPAYEYMVSAPMPGKEEYHQSEKYEIYHWDWNHQNKLTTLIGRLNRLRHEHASLQQTNNIQFCATDSDQVIAYHKWDDEKSDETLMICSIDPYQIKQAWVQLPLQSLGIAEGRPIRVVELITGNTYIWDREWNFVELHPSLPFHLFKIYK